MECMRPLSTLALSRLDMARTVQWRREARRRDIPLFRPPTAWPSSSTSLQSLSRFMKRVKYLQGDTRCESPGEEEPGQGTNGWFYRTLDFTLVCSIRCTLVHVSWMTPLTTLETWQPPSCSPEIIIY